MRSCAAGITLARKGRPSGRGADLSDHRAGHHHDGLVRQSIQIEPEWVDETTGEGQWVATVRYGIRPPSEVGESSFAFDTSGGTQHITQSLRTIASYAASGTPPHFGGAVGVTHDSVEGVDITIPVYSFSQTHFLDAAYVTPGHRQPASKRRISADLSTSGRTSSPAVVGQDQSNPNSFDGTTWQKARPPA